MGNRFRANQCIVVAALALAGFWISACGQSGGDNSQSGNGAPGQSAPGGGAGQQAQPMDVGYIELQPTQVELTDDLPGRVVSYQVAEIRPQVSGIIESRLFEEGTFVEEGQQLYQIDDDTYQSDYEMAVANLQRAKAAEKNAQRQQKRFSELIKTNAISQQQFDDALDNLEQAEASVSVAQAEVRAAEVNLEYTKVYSPISGYISPSSVTKGALVTALQQEPLATVRQLDPVYVDISQSAAETQNLQSRLMASRLGDAPSKPFEVTLMLGANDRIYPQKGTLKATDLAVDRQTGAIKLRSVFPNPEHVLLPGMFVRALVEEVGRSEALVVPQQSVVIGPDGGKAVWVASADDKAQKRSVRTGTTYKNQWVILQGLQAGDRVIVEGTMMLREGAPLKLERLERSGSRTLQANAATSETPNKPDPAVSVE